MKFFKRFVILFIILSSVETIYPQTNLVPNPGFETFSICPTGLIQLNRAVPWYQPTGDSVGGTSDFYHRCGPFGNWIFDTATTNEPHTGNGVAAFLVQYIFNSPGSEYREYIQAPLLDTLKKCRYYAEMYISFVFNYSSRATDDIGMYFGKGPDTALYPLLISKTPQITNPQGFILNDTAWTKVSGTFMANGGEDHITIGCFVDDNNITVVNYGSHPLYMSYYMVDDIYLEALEPIVVLPPDTTICQGDSMVLDAGAGFSKYVWQNGDTTQTMVVKTPGLYWVEITDTTDCGGIDRDSIIISFYPKPVISINDTAFCSRDSATIDAGSGYNSYLWQNGSTNQTFTATTAGTIWVEITDSNGCVNRDSAQVTIYPSPVVNLNDTSVCNGDIAVFNAGTGFISYLWQDNSTNQTFTTDTAGLYWVEVTDTNDCLGRDTAFVTIYPIPVVTLNDTDICQGETVVLNAGAGFISYLWQDNSINQTIIVNTGGFYWVEVTDTNNCKGRDTAQIIVHLNPIVYLGEDTILCESQVILDALNNGADYQWQNGSTNQTYTVKTYGIYWVIVTDSNNCSATDTITFAPCPSEIFVPNAFTPNADGVNDIFRASGINITMFEMYIYNRWGELIFESSNMEQGWDGKYDEKLCQDGVYSWLIFYKDLSNSTKTKVGDVTLLH